MGRTIRRELFEEIPTLSGSTCVCTASMRARDTNATPGCDWWPRPDDRGSREFRFEPRMRLLVCSSGEGLWWNMKSEPRLTPRLPFTGPSIFFLFFFFWKVCLCLFPVYLVGFLFFLFLVLPRGLTNIWILLDDEQCPYSRGIVYFNS